MGAVRSCTIAPVATMPAVTATGPATLATRRARRRATGPPRRSTWSAAVVTTTAAATVPSSARPNRPRPGVTLRMTTAVTNGMSNEPTPIVRLVVVSSLV